VKILNLNFCLRDLVEKLLFTTSTGRILFLPNSPNIFHTGRRRLWMQIIGTSEYAYLKRLDYDVKVENIVGIVETISLNQRLKKTRDILL
jgi:hypothetical protein